MGDKHHSPHSMKKSFQSSAKLQLQQCTLWTNLGRWQSDCSSLTGHLGTWVAAVVLRQTWRNMTPSFNILQDVVTAFPISTISSLQCLCWLVLWLQGLFFMSHEAQLMNPIAFIIWLVAVGCTVCIHCLLPAAYRFLLHTLVISLPFHTHS